MNIIKEIGRLLLVFALQVLLFDHLHIGHWGVVMMYVLCLIGWDCVCVYVVVCVRVCVCVVSTGEL